MNKNSVWVNATQFFLKFLAICGLCYATSTPLFAQKPTELETPNTSVKEDDSLDSEPAWQEDPLISRGRYLTAASNCYGCHTNEPDYPYAGGKEFYTPFGTLYSSNITPDKITGIGSMNDEQFYKTLHQGRGKNGEHLYPVMPYDSYTQMTHDDVIAIKAYLLSERAIRQENRENNLSFPFSMRWILVGWNLFNFNKGEFSSDASKTAVINRGAYLATALGHCSTCHTPRTLTMGSEHKSGLSGDIVTTGWYAPNITPDTVSGIGRWSDEELTQYLTAGFAPGKANATGPMAATAVHSLSKLSDEDIQALIAWLRNQQPIRNKTDLSLPDARTQFEWGEAQDLSDQHRQTIKDYSATPSAINTSIEPVRFYYGACASCHGIDGTGSNNSTVPSLVHNSTLGRPNAHNVALVILNGSHRPAIGEHKEVFMPSFKHQFNDEELTALVNWLFQSYGRPQTQITQPDVAKLRLGENPVPPPIISIAKSISIAILSLLVIFVLGALIRYSPRIKAALKPGKRRKHNRMRNAMHTRSFAPETKFQQTKLKEPVQKKDTATPTLPAEEHVKEEKHSL